MYIMRNLPVLLALTASVIITLLDIQYGADFKEISLKLIIGISFFYSIGYILRKMFFVFLMKLLYENERKAKILKKANSMVNRDIANDDDDEELEPYKPKKFNP